MKKDLVCQWKFDHKIWGALPIIVQGCIESAVFLINRLTFVDLSATKTILAAFRQTYPSRLKSASLILRILKALCLIVPFKISILRQSRRYYDCWPLKGA